MKFGQIKFFAHQLIRGFSIPLFNDRKINQAISDFARRIRLAQTKRKNP